MGGGLLEAEHQARYRLALPYVRDKVVLDAGCGVGWGAALLLDAGARCVVGMDNSQDAERDFTVGVPGAHFVFGDLATAPFADDAFDAVVCCEALEHTTATAAALDGLTRVLRPDGMLFVSPNPAVYPSGNPFHRHELSPGKLAAEGHTPYAVAVAGGGAPRDIRPVHTVLASHQLTDLANLVAGLTEERAQLQGGYDSLAAERERLVRAVAERATQAEQLTRAVESANARLRDADHTLHEVLAQRDHAIAQLADQVDPIGAPDGGVPGSLIEPCEQCARLRGDRDEFAAALVRCEQDLAIARARAESTETVLPQPPTRRERSEPEPIRRGRQARRLSGRWG